MNPPDASPTPAPIHDILPPVDYFPYPIWLVVLVALAGVAILGGLIWFFFVRKRLIKPMTATERAMARLAGLRSGLDTMDAYAFSIEVSEVVREYLEASENLDATRQTTREFLDSIRRRTSFPADQTEKLEAFLSLADLIKFAKLSAGPEESRELLETAETLVSARVAAAHAEGTK